METFLQPAPGSTSSRIAAFREIGTHPHRTSSRDLRRVVALWIERRSQRRALARLDARLLADIGITPAEAAREIARPFWR